MRQPIYFLAMYVFCTLCVVKYRKSVPLISKALDQNQSALLHSLLQKRTKYPRPCRSTQENRLDEGKKMGRQATDRPTDRQTYQTLSPIGLTHIYLLTGKKDMTSADHKNNLFCGQASEFIKKNMGWWWLQCSAEGQYRNLGK